MALFLASDESVFVTGAALPGERLKPTASVASHTMDQTIEVR